MNPFSKKLERKFKLRNIPTTRLNQDTFTVGDYTFTRLFPNSKQSVQICNNKHITKEVLKKLGINVPDYYLVTNTGNNLDKKINFPVVIKPTNGSLSENVYCNIDNEKDLDIFKNKILQSNQIPMVEEYIEGTKYRCLVTREKIISVIKYELSSVIGDGKTKLVDLLNNKNIKVVDDHYLKIQKVDLNTILEKNKIVYPTAIASLSHGSKGIELYPDYPKQLDVLPNIVRNINGFYVGGFDCIIDNNNKLFVIEINGNTMLRNTKLVINKNKKINAFNELFNYYKELVKKPI